MPWIQCTVSYFQRKKRAKQALGKFEAAASTLMHHTAIYIPYYVLQRILEPLKKSDDLKKLYH